MATPGKEFEFNKGAAELRRFEAYYRRVQEKVDAARSKDPRGFKSKKDAGAFLTRDVLNRKGGIKGGRDKLVMALGNQGGQVAFTLRDLEKFAKTVDATAAKFDSNTHGVPPGMLLRTARKIDMERARDIKNATLYKIVAGNLLQFRVTASGETKGAPTHYLVRVRLEEFHDVVTHNRSTSYMKAAGMAAGGRVSLDCTCGRYRFWYHYLASIGNYDLEPHEGTFPKIRNPGLTGTVCKHLLKTLVILQQPAVRNKIAAEMEREAKSQATTTTAARALSKHEIDKTSLAGDKDFDAAFRDFKAAMRGYKEASSKPENAAKREKLHKRAAMEQKQAINDAVHKVLVEKLKDFQKILPMIPGATLATLIDKAENSDILRTIAKEEGML